VYFACITSGTQGGSDSRERLKYAENLAYNTAQQRKEREKVIFSFKLNLKRGLK